MFRFAQEQRTRRVQSHVGLHKGSPGEFSCTQSLPLGALLDGRKGLATHFLGPDFSLVLYTGFAMFRDDRKKRTQKFQLHVGLRKGSPGEFSCTQSLPLGALLHGPKGLGTHFLGPDFSVVFNGG